MNAHIVQVCSGTRPVIPALGTSCSGCAHTSRPNTVFSSMTTAYPTITSKHIGAFNDLRRKAWRGDGHQPVAAAASSCWSVFMIWNCITDLLRWIVWLFKPVERQPIHRLDSPCPVCGHRDGRHRAVQVDVSKTSQPDVKIMCQNACRNCGGRRHLPPVAKLQEGEVWPCPPRNEQELREEKTLPVTTKDVLEARKNA